MKFFFYLVCLFLNVSLIGILKPSSIYPPVNKTLEGHAVCKGDRHGDFKGDLMAELSDGSLWKIHPDCREEFQRWQIGEKIHVAKRSDRFWFKREHHFLLINHFSNSSVKAMLFRHGGKDPLRIVDTESYYKSISPKFIKEVTKTEDNNGKEKVEEKDVYIGNIPSNPRKILRLSDGSEWVIKDLLGEFQKGMKVYIGAQRIPQRIYDFVLIIGDEREVIYTLARPQK